jgi:DNA-directed RNA polymerase specialized sigma24 family protein
MSIASEIAPYIPLLRRFARALTGSQKSGDAYVAATLEAIIADPLIFPDDMPRREGLYRIFLRLWSSANRAQPRGATTDLRGAVERNLEAITPLPRQAFLLRTIEGFTMDETASILGKSPQEASNLVDAAGVEIAAQLATKVLIIEDEPMIALDIEALVRDLGHEVIGIARTQNEAINFVSDREPGLVLADIQLADGSSGLDAVNDILRDIAVPVIFITAFPELLLTGERPEPTFLIAKPFRPESVKAAISQALFFDQRAVRRTA